MSPKDNFLSIFVDRITFLLISLETNIIKRLNIIIPIKVTTIEVTNVLFDSFKTSFTGI